MSPVEVLYCGVCTAPPEYCEFGPSIKRCKVWLKETHPDLFSKIYPSEAGGASDAVAGVTEKLANASVSETSTAAPADASAKKPAPEKEKLDALQKQELKKEKQKQNARVTIKRIERTKRKCVIIVVGLEIFEVDLKKAAKLFANKFACGSSVTKNPAGFDEIVVQGDCQDDIYDLILKTWKHIPEDNLTLE
ncbi:Translation machinery-associated protein 22 [Chytriomyces hyalinus]|nr:Translation machinery-associated protein 22 [Chytriomyces hyalinus]